MSAPRTMLPEELESVRASVWHAKQIPVDSRDTVEHALIALDAELDAERAAFTALERDLAAAQAEVVELRDVLKNHARCPLPEREHHALKYFTEDKPCPRCRVTSRPPGSLSALAIHVAQALADERERVLAFVQREIDNMDVDANPQIDTPHKMWVACSSMIAAIRAAAKGALDLSDAGKP